MANLISRGFGALQRIITRGFNSASKPSPDCLVGFIGSIEFNNEPLGFVGAISGSSSFISAIDEGEAAFISNIGDSKGFNGSLCNDVCKC